MKIREVQENDLEKVLKLNEAAVPHVTSIPLSDFKAFINNATYFLVAEKNGEVVGFVIALNEGSKYESLNYKFFNSHYTNFTYIDRIVVEKEQRGQGLGSKFYNEIKLRMKSNILCCEVNIKPPNPNSMSFHQKNGFVEMSKLVTENGTKVVSLLVNRIDARDKL